jgi:histidinol-phosphate aminotransferase
MGNITKLLKPYIQEASPYSPTAHLRQLYAQRSDYIRLQANELPFGISPKVKQAIIDALPKAHLYPDSAYHDVKQALAQYTGFDESHLVLANGSTQFLDGFYHGFINPGDSVLFIPPDYGPYRIRLAICGGKPQFAPRAPPEYSWDFDQVVDAITPETKVVVVVSPNNPCGDCVPETGLRQLLDQDVLVVVDEAYFEFADSTLVHLVKNYENLIVTRTFAKVFGFAGLRLGYAITTPELATYLGKVLHHFPVNRLTAAAAVAALTDAEFLNYVRREIRANRTYLEKGLNKLDGVRAFPSQTNFVLSQLTKTSVASSQVTQKLLENGILVRDYTGKAGLEGEFIRITVGTKEQNKAVIQGIKTAIN